MTTTKSMTPKVETKEVKIEKAFIVPADLGEKIIQVFGELPHKFSPLFGPVLQALTKCYRSDLTLNVPVDTKSQKPAVRKEGDT